MNDDRARQGIEHLQAAGIEVISALRAFLDAAETLVRDPAAAEHEDEPRVTRIRVS